MTNIELCLLEAINQSKIKGLERDPNAVTEALVGNIEKTERLAKLRAEFDSIQAQMLTGNTMQPCVEAHIEEAKQKAFDWATKREDTLAKEQKTYDIAITVFTAAASAAIAGATGGGGIAMAGALLPVVTSFLGSMSDGAVSA